MTTPTASRVRRPRTGAATVAALFERGNAAGSDKE